MSKNELPNLFYPEYAEKLIAYDADINAAMNIAVLGMCVSHPERPVLSCLLHGQMSLFSISQIWDESPVNSLRGKLTNESTYNILMISFRSLKGADISQLPSIIKLETEKYFQYQLQKKMNKRLPQQDENQLSLDFNFD